MNPENLIAKLSKFSIEDAIIAEKNDRQFLAISRLEKSIPDSKYFFPLIIANSLISYQLSWLWEDYWEEFSKAASVYEFSKDFDFEILYSFFNSFLFASKCNKRLLNMKLPRLKKAEKFIKEIIWNERKLYSDIEIFLNKIASDMKQKKDDKTILFAVKMFHYAAMARFSAFNVMPFEIWMPLDSRIAKIEKLYNSNNMDSQTFWKYIAKTINIPQIHLDAVIWTRYNDFI